MARALLDKPRNWPVRVEEVLAPETARPPMMVEETPETKPPLKKVRPATFAVEDTDSGPETLSWALTVEDAVERKPFVNVDRPATDRVPMEKLEWVDVAIPLKNTELEALRLPATSVLPPIVSPPPTEDDTEEIKPFASVAREPTSKLDGVEVATPLKNTELEAFIRPVMRAELLTVRGPEMLEDAEEIKPPVRVARPETLAVEKTDKGPETVNCPFTVDEPIDKNPPDSVARLVTERVFPSVAAPFTARDDEAESGPATLRLAAILDDALEISPPNKLARLFTSSVEEAFSGPPTCNPLTTVDDAAERNPPVSVASPDTANVEDIVVGPVTDSVPPKLEDALEINPPVADSKSLTLRVL